MTQVFDLDGTQLAALRRRRARGGGARVARPRPGGVGRHRLLQKQRAGAPPAVLNHAGSAREVERSSRPRSGPRAHDSGPGGRRDLHRRPLGDGPLGAAPGSAWTGTRVERVLRASDTEKAGVESAVEEALQLLSLEHVAGVNLSGLASGQGVQHAAEVKAEVGRRIKEQV